MGTLIETNEEKHQTLKEQIDDSLFDFFENTKHVLCSDKTRSEIVDVCLQKFREWLEQRREQVKTKSLYQDALFNTDYILLSKLIEEVSF